jgi:hypothetical protein
VTPAVPCNQHTHTWLWLAGRRPVAVAVAGGEEGETDPSRTLDTATVVICSSSS